MTPRSIAIGITAAAIAIVGLVASGAVSISDPPARSVAASAPSTQAAATSVPAAQPAGPGPTPTMDSVAYAAQIQNESQMCQCNN
jgi:hypothetical protein